MKILANGWVLIAHERDVVIAMQDRPYGTEYAVWSLDNDGNTLWGLYTKSIRNAVDQFHWKLENLSGKPVEPKLYEGPV